MNEERDETGWTGGIVQLRYLEGCVQEAMRLWLTTPMLVREVLAADTLSGVAVPAGRQVVVWNSPNHRDRAAYRLADTFSPEAWAGGRPSPLFNHVSSGPQVCAGVNLLLFVGNAVIATMLGRGRYVLLEPPLEPDRPMPYAYNDRADRCGRYWRSVHSDRRRSARVIKVVWQDRIDEPSCRSS